VGCVLATYLDAFSYDYKAFMIKGAMLSHSAEYTNQIEDIFSAVDLETVMFMLEIGSSR
jgi:nicotinamidase-related amidase